MSDEKLRLIAEVQDRMSPALLKIKDTLNSVRKSPGMEAATDGMKKLGVETAKFATSGGNATEILGAMGVGGLATAGSLAAVVVQMRALGDRSLAMKELARETGLSANWLNVWSHAGLHFNVSAEAMQGALNHLTEQMPQFRRHIGSLYSLMAQRWPNLTRKILGEDAEHQVQDIVGLLDKLKNEPQLQKQLAGEFFGNGEEIEKLFKDGAKGFWEEFERQQKLRNPINPELLKQAQNFKDAQIGFNIALENFENKVGPGFLRVMSDIVNTASALLGDHGAAERLDKDFHSEVQKKLGPAKREFDDLRKPQSGSSNNGILGPGDPGYDKAPYIDEKGVLHKSRWSGNNPLLHKSAFITGEPARNSTYVGFEGLITDGTKAGVLAAFRELMATNDAANAAGGGFTHASFETGGRSVGGFGGSGGAAGYGIGGGAAHRAHGDLLGPGGDTPAGSLHASKNMAAHAQETYDFWRNAGLSRNAALGFVGNEQGEGTLADGRPHLHWDRKHFSGGIVQWDPSRRADILKHTGIDVWHDANHQHQLEAEQWELKNRYPDLWKALRGGKISIGQATHGLVFGYERPANKEGQARLRGSYGAAWGNRLDDTRKATGLTSPDAGTGASKAGKPAEGHIRADIHVHGGAHKAVVKTRGQIEATLHRWPKMHEFA